MDDAAAEPSRPAPDTRPILERWPSWAWLAVLGGIVAFVWLLTLVSREVFYENFVNEYYWQPIVGDEGYNVVNTASWAVLLLLLILWAYRLTTELKERVDFSMILALLPFLTLGSVYRVLEDSDLFAPYNTGNSCLPDATGGFLDTCFGVFFITPIIYVEVAFVAAGFLIVGHWAQRIATTKNVNEGLKFVGGVLLAGVLLYIALWSAEPTWVRYVQSPLWIFASAAVAYFVVDRHARSAKTIDPHIVLFAGGLFVLLPGLLYVLQWMSGGSWGSGPDAELGVQPWILAAIVVAPLLLAWSCLEYGRSLARSRSKKADGSPEPKPRPGLALIVVALLVASLGIFVTMLAAKDLAENVTGTALAQFGGGLVLWGLTIAVARQLPNWGFPGHPKLIHYAAPTNLLMVLAQTADGLITSLGIDGFGYTEKHVLPGRLISWARESNIDFVSTWAASIVMIPLKLAIVLAVVWIIDVSAQDPRKNLIGLIKLAIIMVGLSPAIRNATRLAMGT